MATECPQVPRPCGPQHVPLYLVHPGKLLGVLRLRAQLHAALPPSAGLLPPVALCVLRVCAGARPLSPGTAALLYHLPLRVLPCGHPGRLRRRLSAPHWASAAAAGYNITAAVSTLLPHLLSCSTDALMQLYGTNVACCKTENHLM